VYIYIERERERERERVREDQEEGETRGGRSASPRDNGRESKSQWLRSARPYESCKNISSHLSGWGINVTFLRPHESHLIAMCCVALNQIDPRNIIYIRTLVLLCLNYSTLSSPLPFRYDKNTGKEQVFRSFVFIGFSEKAVWSVVKSWKFERNWRCSKVLRICKKNSLKRIWSFSREYWVYSDITWKRSSEFEFWGEFGKSERLFSVSKFRNWAK